MASYTGGVEVVEVVHPELIVRLAVSKHVVDDDKQAVGRQRQTPSSVRVGEQGLLMLPQATSPMIARKHTLP
jgi:hypothetical protein